MGTDKAKLRLGNTTFLARARQAAADAGLPVRVIRRDLVPRCGPLGGVMTALRTTQADAVLFLSCDMPFVNAALLVRVLDRLRSGARAVFLERESRGFPFVIRTASAREVEAFVAAGQRSLQSLSRQLRAASVRLRSGEAHLAVNVNTPEDYEEARRLWRESRR